MERVKRNIFADEGPEQVVSWPAWTKAVFTGSEESKLGLWNANNEYTASYHNVSLSRL